MYDSEAKERQKRKPNSVVEKLPPQNAGEKSRDAVGKTFGVSGKSIDNRPKWQADSKRYGKKMTNRIVTNVTVTA